MDMSGPIRKLIGPIHKRLVKYIEAYKRDTVNLSQPLGDLDNSSLAQFHKELRLHSTKLEKTIQYLESAHNSWIQFITSLTSSDERSHETRIYDEFQKDHGDLTSTLEAAKDAVDEITTHVDSYKTEMLARKEEDDLSEGYINDSPSGRDTPIVTAAPLAEIAQPANSTLPYLPPVTIPPFYGDITKWPAFWETYNAMIHSQQLAECIKFYHLKNLLRGEAAQIISGLNTDSYNYSVAISLLTDAYGNTDDICHKLRAQVISFSITGQTAPTMLKSYQHLIRIFRQLQNLGENTDTTTYAQIIESRFPKHLMMKVIPHIRARPITATALLEKIGTVLKQEATVDRIYSDNRNAAFLSHRPPYIKPNERSEQLMPQSSTFAAESTFRKSEKRCAYCFNNSHVSSTCQSYATPATRKNRSIELKLCFNCLGSHNYKECKSNKSCRTCGKKHHTSLCRDSNKSNSAPTDRQNHKNSIPRSLGSGQQKRVSFAQPAGNRPQENANICCSGTVIDTNNSALETLLMCRYVTVSNPYTRKSQRVLAFFDSGSNRSYITTSLAKDLHLSSNNVEQLQINTFANKASSLLRTHSHSLDILLHNRSKLSLTVQSVNVMTSSLRFAPISNKNINSVNTQSTLTLPIRSEKPSLLIGSDHLWDILNRYSYTKIPSGFILLRTQIGPIIIGKDRIASSSLNATSIYTIIDNSYSETNTYLENFWNLESIGILDKPETSDDEESMRHFSATVVKQHNGYIVRWPWKSAQPNLPSNLALCTSRLHATYKKLSTKKELLKQYDSIFKEQLALNIIELVDPTKRANGPLVHYLPHHPVINLHKASTKMRIVYDASAKTKNNCSLNDCLYRGPVLLPDLCGILLRFRLAPVAIIADVEKAFCN